MGYTIELSFNIWKHGNVSKLKNQIEIFARNHKCDDCYFIFEFDEKNPRERNHCVIIIEFDEEQIKNIVQFVNDLINNKEEYYIESIYRSRKLSEHIIIHASPHYLTLMNYESKMKYKERRKNRDYTTNDYLILRKLLNLPKLQLSK